MRDPVLVPLLDHRIGVEAVVVPDLSVWRADVAPTHILVHPAEIIPIVDEGDHQLESQLASLVNDVIQMFEPCGAVVVSGRASRGIPVLEIDTIRGPAYRRRGIVRIADIQ